MPWPYPDQKSMERCPCCKREVVLNTWEIFIIGLAWDSTSYWSGEPARVLCVDRNGRAVKKGYAVTVRFHDGPIYIGVLRRPDDWTHGWWWPLDRVLWEIEKEPN